MVEFVAIKKPFTEPIQDQELGWMHLNVFSI